MCSSTTRTILPEPPEKLKQLSHELTQIIAAKIARKGPIPFADYMEMALYEPGLGYYSAGLRKIGDGGDFVTAPQLGNVFARCLANQLSQVGSHLGSYEILEIGAGNGVLAADLLTALQDHHPPARYRILERSAHLRQVQQETLAAVVPQWMDKISWLDTPPTAGWQGVVLTNEVIDALAVERFCVEPDGISRLCVAHDETGFGWHKGVCETALAERIQTAITQPGQALATGYCSEINPHLPTWLHTVTESLSTGLALFIDYGYPRREYYLPQRRDGTFICHYQQRAHGDPFLWPGLTDISASADFTALAEAADHCGLEVSGYTSQAMFLLANRLEDIIAGFQSLTEKEQVLMNGQVRRLTLPGEMGERFQVMALSRGLDEGFCEELDGFMLADLRYRL